VPGELDQFKKGADSKIPLQKFGVKTDNCD